MKTKEVIKLLQEADPTGEEEVCVNNVDIFFIEKLLAYYDGSSQVLIRNNNRIIGAKYKRSGWKIQIVTHSISSVVETDPDAFIDYSELPTDRQEKVKIAHDKLREFVRDVDNKAEFEIFGKWVRSKAEALTEDLEDLNFLAWDFFDKNLSRKDPIKMISGESYASSRHRQWDSTIDICLEDGYLTIKRKLND